MVLTAGTEAAVQQQNPQIRKRKNKSQSKIKRFNLKLESAQLTAALPVRFTAVHYLSN